MEFDGGAAEQVARTTKRVKPRGPRSNVSVSCSSNWLKNQQEEQQQPRKLVLDGVVAVTIFFSRLVCWS